MTKKKNIVTALAAFIIAMTLGLTANLLFVGIGWWSMLVYATLGTWLFHSVYKEYKPEEEVKEVIPGFDYTHVNNPEDEDTFH